MCQLSLTLLKKLNQLATQFDCLRAKFKIKPIQAEIVAKQAYSLSLSLSLKKRNVKLYIQKIVSE